MIEYESDLTPLFSKAVYSRQTNIDTQSIVDCVDDFEWRESGNYSGNHVNISWSTVDNMVLNSDKLLYLKDEIYKEVRSYVDQMKYMNDFEITTSWFTKSLAGQSSNVHNHRNSVISGVLYFQADENCGDIKFHDMSREGLLLNCSEDNIFNAHCWKFTPKNGLILIFPSEMYHSIAPGTSDIVRHSLAFNLMPIGRLGPDESDSTVIVDSWSKEL